MKEDIEATKIIEYLKRNSSVIPKFCDNCGTMHQEDNLQVIGTRNGTVSCRIHCHNCSASHILNVAMPVNGIGVASRAPINVDLTSADEFNKFASKTAISDDEAISTYKTLTKMRGVSDFLKAINGD
jgi:hypothetical protein